jgi:hypothetical protein
MPPTTAYKQNLVQLAGMVTPEIVTDIFRANGGVLLFNKLGIIDDELVAKFEDCFDQLRTQLVGVKGLIRQ